MIIESFSKAPPVKIFIKPNIWNCSKICFKFSGSIPGTGILAITLTTAKIPKTKRILFLNSLILNT
jgi:hypothetical protein